MSHVTTFLSPMLHVTKPYVVCRIIDIENRLWFTLYLWSNLRNAHVAVSILGV